MKLLVSHPTGNNNVRAVVSSFYKSNLLVEFATTVAVESNAKWLNFLPIGVRNELLRRSFHISKQLVWTHSSREVARMLLPKLGFRNAGKNEKNWASIYQVYKDFDKAVSKRLLHHAEKKTLNAVYAYEDGALVTFQAAKKMGVACVYDLPIAYWQTVRNLLQEESERLPNWKNTLGGGISDSNEKLDRKTQELEQADVVICPGAFVKNSLPDWTKKKKIIISPFGSPITSPQMSHLDKRHSNENHSALKVLFVGSMGQRKGLGDLFAAFKLLNNKNVELIVMGSLLDDINFYRRELSSFTYEPGRSHKEVLALMRSCDVFCLPSIVEGRALVIQEAMSQGLPIVITPNTGGADLVIEGETGFLIPIRNPEAIASKINWFSENREQTKTMGLAAQKLSAQYTWDQYGENIVREVLNFIE